MTTPAEMARILRAEIDGRPAWSYIFDSDLEHIQQELPL